jgi:hypothetical protein
MYEWIVKAVPNCKLQDDNLSKLGLGFGYDGLLLTMHFIKQSYQIAYINVSNSNWFERLGLGNAKKHLISLKS